MEFKGMAESAAEFIGTENFKIKVVAQANFEEAEEIWVPILQELEGSGVQIKSWIVPEFPAEELSMFRLRRMAHELFGPPAAPWLLFDDDDRFREGSGPYLLDTAKELKRAEEAFGRPVFIGTAGVFGSRAAGNRVHLSPPNALMPKGHGLLFSDHISFAPTAYEAFEVLGGLEEAMMCALAIAHMNAVPMKRFMNPTKVKRRTEEQRRDSLIHNYNIWDRNAMQVIRSLSDDWGWSYPIGMGKKGRKSPLFWEKRTRELAKLPEAKEYVL